MNFLLMINDKQFFFHVNQSLCCMIWLLDLIRNLSYLLRSDFITRYQVINLKLAPLITLDLTHKDVVTINVTRNLTSDLYYYNLGF